MAPDTSSPATTTPTSSHNSALINLNVLKASTEADVGRLFYSSSACIYPSTTSSTPTTPSAPSRAPTPADPDSEYGWEKLFSERLYLSFARNYGLTVRIARYHNIFGPEGAWTGGKEKAPAASVQGRSPWLRTGARSRSGATARQTRSFLHVDECVEGTLRLIRSDFEGPVNIGSDEMVSINRLAEMIAEIAGKRLMLEHVPGPQGVRGRTSDNRLIRERLDWAPERPLEDGLRDTYRWIAEQVAASATA